MAENAAQAVQEWLITYVHNDPHRDNDPNNEIARLTGKMLDDLMVQHGIAEEDLCNLGIDPHEPVEQYYQGMQDPELGFKD